MAGSSESDKKKEASKPLHVTQSFKKSLMLCYDNTLLKESFL